MATKFTQGKDGIVRAYRDGKYIGPVLTMGDFIGKGTAAKKATEEQEKKSKKK